MPKQQNALTCYINHTLLPDLKRQGRSFPNGIADLIPIAAPLFKSLPPHEKTRYEEMAKNSRSKNGNSTGNLGRRDNCGNIIAKRQDPRQLLLQKRKDDRAFMRQYFPPNDAILDCKFYIIGFQYMVEVESATQNDFMPVEVGLVEWSMHEGVTSTLHKFINPGEFPLGYRFKCQEHAEETHRIPLDQIRTFDRNYSGIWIQIENFIKSQDGDLSVYCLENEYERVLGCLQWLHRHANTYNRPMRFNLRFLEDLSSELYFRQGKNIAEASILEMLTTAVFDYDPNTSCEFHEENECKYCALGTPKRYTFAMSDALSVVYNFDLTEKHLPVRTGSTSSYVLTGSVEGQMVPEISSYRQPMASAGRGYTVDPEGFGGRDIRYSGVGNKAAAYVVPASTTPDSFSNVGSSVNNPRFANTCVRAPSANQLPSPAFTTPDVVRSMSSLCVNEENTIVVSPPLPTIPTRSADMPRTPSASMAIAAMLQQMPSSANSYDPENNQQSSRSHGTLSQTSSLPNFDAFAAPGIGRGRGLSMTSAVGRPGSVGRGAAMRDLPSCEERPAPRIPPGFQGVGRGGAMFY